MAREVSKDKSYNLSQDNRKTKAEKKQLVKEKKPQTNIDMKENQKNGQDNKGNEEQIIDENNDKIKTSDDLQNEQKLEPKRIKIPLVLLIMIIFILIATTIAVIMGLY